MLHPLDGSFAKINRAEKHIQHFKREVKFFLDQQPYTAKFEKDSDTNTIRLIAKASKVSELPLEFALLAGEVVHQLRSALDHAVYDLCSLRYRRPPRDPHFLQFPICDTLGEYRKKRKRQIKDIPKLASRLIQQAQPYHRRADKDEDPLFMLQVLNNTDKHRFIPVVVIGGKKVTVMGTNPGEEYGLILEDGFLPLEDGAVLYTMPTPNPDFTMEVNPQLTCDVAFERIGSSKPKPIIPLLRELSTHVHNILRRLSNPSAFTCS